MRFIPICTDSGFPSTVTGIFPLMYQPNEPVENDFTSASCSWPLMTTFSGSAFSRNCDRDTGQGDLTMGATLPPPRA
ncbi:hypothetical protein [Myxococcus sp. RHSTA-1-4]|uniref:hypothetical protein n=1 Tax=Myxococcus sp. RHSTA-1-4 TaxID=2874601 RepID=UPI001CBFB766|nr:hypothetical protein [Myxococcus sp. RHSTA-1-4]MBZ4422981.1 hypothetical protein [Myxococcus sp. RHSTA-1-4]